MVDRNYDAYLNKTNFKLHLFFMRKIYLYSIDKESIEYNTN